MGKEGLRVGRTGWHSHEQEAEAGQLVTFTTLTFLLFLVTVWTLYWVVRNRGAQNILLLLGSYAFYAWWDYRFLLLLFLSSIIDFGVGLGLGRWPAGKKWRRRLLLYVSLSANLGMLFFFKYFNFFTESLTALTASLGLQVNPIALRVVLPVGISFYTFQTLSYTLDIYRGKISPSSSLVDYMAYVAFFPQLVAGPIERARNLLPQFLNSRQFDSEAARDGLRQILWGLMKKMVLADNLGAIVDHYYAQPNIATVCFAFQIYCDFSAYSDIAIGTAKLFGFRLMQNFAYPYFAQSVPEFWQRWHISLSTWFRDYVYIPLGGSRVGRMRWTINIMATFLISGLWHGASWNFVVWGAINGILMLLFVYSSVWFGYHPVHSGARKKPRTVIHAVCMIALTFFLTCLTWVFFRAQSLPEAIVIYQRMFTQIPTLSQMPHLARSDIRLLVLLSLFVVIEWIRRAHPHPLAQRERPANPSLHRGCPAILYLP